MAKPLVLNFGGADLPLALAKVERSDLYGYVEIETLDEQGRKCAMANLANDGKCVMATGGSALASLSADGQWMERKALIATDQNGQKITPVPSSYAAPVPLKQTATIDEYLEHNIRAVYQISSEADLSPLMSELKKGTMFKFPYSYRGGLEPDAAFLLLASDGTPFLAIGSPAKLEFVAFANTAGVTPDEEEAAEEEESLDFGMM